MKKTTTQATMAHTLEIKQLVKSIHVEAQTLNLLTKS